MTALGDSFRTARESQGLTFADVEERIHIRAVYLEAIEAEDWRAIGPPVYIRGFLRSYARTLGLDPDAAVAQFASAAQRAALPSPLVAAPSRIDALPGDRDGAAKRGLSLGAVAGVLIALALVAFAGYEYLDYRHAGPRTPVHVGRPKTPATQPNQAARESAVPRPARPNEVRSIAKADDRPSGFGVRLRDSSWLRIVVDGKLEMEGIYPKGTQRTFTGRSATVRVGNAGGVVISVDGKDLGRMGGLGDVAERSYQL